VGGSQREKKRGKSSRRERGVIEGNTPMVDPRGYKGPENEKGNGDGYLRENRTSEVSKEDKKITG